MEMDRPIGYWLKHLDRLIEAAADGHHGAFHRLGVLIAVALHESPVYALG